MEDIMMMINGKIVKDEKIQLDEGYLFGKGIFETILVQTKPVFLEEHLHRLNEGLIKLGIQRKVEENYVLECIEKLQAKQCAVKLMVSEKNIIFTQRKIPYEVSNYETGFKVKISALKRNAYSHSTYLKSFNYTDNALERKTALELGYNEALFLNTEGYLAEGCATNVFFLKEGQIFTPSMECGLLNGIVRQWIIKNYEVIEGKYKLDLLENAEGIFLTNSLLGIMKVVKLEDKDVEVHPIIEKIQEEYNFYIGRGGA